MLAAVASAVSTKAATGRVIAYVGAYTDRGKGIHSFDVGSDGSLTPIDILTGIPSPSSLVFSPSNKFMYAVNEISNFEGTTTGSVTSISVAADGALKIVNVMSSGGGGPAPERGLNGKMGVCCQLRRRQRIGVADCCRWVRGSRYGDDTAATEHTHCSVSKWRVTETIEQFLGERADI